ncbi:nuclear transport factor 2 family protein [Phenylobacterium sp.]|jgi:hypothetical protein|uniref:nuclear transport factor 2 family protein n=1 Tax=Phenylobacterium sp. TaxID=1871053 RepID=UPI002F93E3CC
MPDRRIVEAFVADVLSEDHVGAIERWYAQDAYMQENQGERRVGREVLMEGERKTLARFAGVKTELVAPPVIDGDQVPIRWRFTFTGKDGSTRSFEEVAWQTWAGEEIIAETFFYDPAQMKG